MPGLTDVPKLLSRYVDIRCGGKSISIEYAWIAPERGEAPLLVFLHEGLGSLAMWRDFPQRLCQASNCRGLVYSRPGYGFSTPRAGDENWTVDFMHRHADEVLPALLQALHVDGGRQALWLLGHSDGGSIALLYAAKVRQLAGVVVLAPHISVEKCALDSIRKARIAYESGNLRTRLAPFHHDPDSAFWGWNRVWLSPEFTNWSIVDDLPAIVCPVLAIQGEQDEYATMEQIRGIARHVPGSVILEIPDCGHVPHRDHRETLLQKIPRFMQGLPI